MTKVWITHIIGCGASDGVSTQFKNNTTFYFVSRYPKISREIKMLWSFFGVSHRKVEDNDIDIEYCEEVVVSLPTLARWGGPK